MKKITLFLCVLLVFAIPAMAAVEPIRFLRFPLPEDAKLDDSGDLFERYQFGKTIMSTWRYPQANANKTIEDYLTELYDDYEGYEVFQSVEVDGNVAECGRFSRLFEGDPYPQLSVLLKTEDVDYLILIDCGSDDPPREEIESWMSELTLE